MGLNIIIIFFLIETHHLSPVLFLWGSNSLPKTSFMYRYTLSDCTGSPQLTTGIDPSNFHLLSKAVAK